MSLDAVPWSPRRWAVTFGVLFVGQIILLIYFGAHQQPKPPAARFPTRVVLTDSDRPLPALSSLTDPTLFALPHPKGFSGEAWLTYQPVDYRWVSWTEPQRWLELKDARLKAPLAQYLPTNPPPPSLAIEWHPRLDSWPLYVPPRVLPTQSTLEIRGDLISADLIELPVLPSWPHRDILGRSVVQILVQPSGAVFSAALLEECGLPEADRRALDLARQLRFKPLAEEGGPADSQLFLATVLFNWHAIPEDGDLTAQRRAGPAQP